MDIWTPEKRSEVMSLIRGTGTKPELALQAIVRAALPRWKVEVGATSIPGRPDVYIPSLRLAIFAHGCFWHSCPRHGKIPKSNIEYWAPKLAANKARDQRLERLLRRRGIGVWNVWEHDLRGAGFFRAQERIAKKLATRVDEMQGHL
jgi:DNA mismatch endonuclease (patch repair protein)